MTVARLVASGRSNREVAAELYVSVKAVEYHLGHVFDEIRIRSVPWPAGSARARARRGGRQGLGTNPRAFPSDTAGWPGHHRHMSPDVTDGGAGE
jgi:hypothetical protein